MAQRAVVNVQLTKFSMWLSWMMLLVRGSPKSLMLSVSHSWLSIIL